MTRGQLVAAGFSNGTIGRWVEAGRLQRLHRGVYVLGHRALAPWARELAAVLAVGEGAIVSHLSAAAVWGMRPEAPRLVDVTVPDRKLGHRDGIRTHRSTRITARDVTSLQTLPVTTPERTLVDFAGLADTPELERALEGARLRKAISEPKLRAAVGRAGQTAGAASVRAILEAEGEPALTRSKAERLARALIRTAGLPSPQVNSRVAGYEVDLCWPRHGVIVEIDSYRFHSSRDAFERDRLKQIRLDAAGFTVLRLTWRRLAREPEAAVADLAGALARAEARVPP
ncbi:MAG: DUF559 domain-containing protein [Actinomycetota bacterium]|nr:DUF559 domain-containing protein [Actinomycetota bacterium]